MIYRHEGCLPYIFPLSCFSPGEGPFPGIVDLYTFGGGLTEPRASLLAKEGFVVLALAYLGYKDLPKKPPNLDLEYFDEAVTYLRRQPEVSGCEDNHILK